MKIRPVVAELFLEDGRTDRREEANFLFPILRACLKVVAGAPVLTTRKVKYEHCRCLISKVV